MTVTDEVVPEVDDAPLPVQSWEFVENAPTTEKVVEMLKTLKGWWGLRPEAFVQFVQPLPQSKNVGTKQQKTYKDVWTLYFTVAGRIAMINKLAEENNWRVEFNPEPTTPTGIPGYMVMDENRIVYRVYVEIWTPRGPIKVHSNGSQQVTEVREWSLLGRRPGTAWVPAEGGVNAVATNRFEKVETSALGRAIAGWGIGVLPGSGVASLEEMVSARETERQQSNQRPGAQQQRPQMTREDVESQVRMILARYEEITGDEERVASGMLAFVRKQFDKELGRKENGAWDLSPLKPGEVVMLRNKLADNVRKLEAANAERADEVAQTGAVT